MSKKFINDPETITDEMLEGLGMVFDEFIDVKGHVVARKGLGSEEPKVTILTIGGSGHEPSSLGFCGIGWECVKVIGDIFAAPGPATIMEGIRIADKGRGILFYVGNHAGDVMTAKIALKMAKKEDINIDVVYFYDDISSFPRSEREQRRGMVCSLGLGKVLGAACEKGMTLEEVKEVAIKYRDNAASLSVATRGASHPKTGQNISVIEENQMVIGMGQHGEGSGLSSEVLTSKETVKLMADRIIEDLELKSGEKVLLVINGAGSTTYMELMILYKDAVAYLKKLRIEVAAKLVGEYLTTQEQGGFQMSMVRMDDQLLDLFNAPCRTAFITKY